MKNKRLASEVVRQTAKNFIKNYCNGVDINPVFINSSDLPEARNRALGFYDEKNNRLIVVQDNFNDHYELNQVLRHEVFAHFSISCLPPQDRADLYKRTAQAIIQDDDVRSDYCNNVMKDYAVGIVSKEIEKGNMPSELNGDWAKIWEYFEKRNELSRIIYPTAIEELYARHSEVKQPVRYSDRLLAKLRSVYHGFLETTPMAKHIKYKMSDILFLTRSFEKKVRSGEMKPQKGGVQPVDYKKKLERDLLDIQQKNTQHGSDSSKKKARIKMRPRFD